jgi:hypothetical protein
MNEIERRALVAYLRTTPGYTDSELRRDPPSMRGRSVEHDGRTYVVVEELFYIRGDKPGQVDVGTTFLAAYRLKTTGMLRRLKRWPAALEDHPLVTVPEEEI